MPNFTDTFNSNETIDFTFKIIDEVSRVHEGVAYDKMGCSEVEVTGFVRNGQRWEVEGPLGDKGRPRGFFNVEIYQLKRGNQTHYAVIGDSDIDRINSKISVEGVSNNIDEAQRILKRKMSMLISDVQRKSDVILTVRESKLKPKTRLV